MQNFKHLAFVYYCTGGLRQHWSETTKERFSRGAALMIKAVTTQLHCESVTTLYILRCTISVINITNTDISISTINMETQNKHNWLQEKILFWEKILFFRHEQSNDCYMEVLKTDQNFRFHPNFSTFTQLTL